MSPKSTCDKGLVLSLRCNGKWWNLEEAGASGKKLGLWDVPFSGALGIQPCSLLSFFLGFREVSSFPLLQASKQWSSAVLG